MYREKVLQMRKKHQVTLSAIIATLTLFVVYAATTMMRTELGWWSNPYVVMINNMSAWGLAGIISGVIFWGFVAKMLKKRG